MVRWPGHIKPGRVSNEIFSGMDWFPTLLAAAGDTTIKDDLLKGTQIGGKTFKVHLDGYNELPYLTGEKPKAERTEFYYFNDDGELVAMRFGDWKVNFCEQRQPGQLDIWANPFTCLRVPRAFNLRMDPSEHAQISGSGYDQWRVENAYLFAEATMKAGQFLQTFVDYPPSQPPASFSIDQIERDVNRQIEENRAKQQKQ
jgi:arylsulfatase